MSETILDEFQNLFDFKFDSFQIEACKHLGRGQSVLVASPTGSGKTIVGQFAVHLALKNGEKAFYTTPIKALSNQKFTELGKIYGLEKVGLLTGDSSINTQAPILVMTTEVLRNMIYAESRTLHNLGYVVMDEVHYLADRQRGAVWEEIIIHLPQRVQLVSLSATVSNAEQFGDWLNTVRSSCTTIVHEERPVPLWQHVMTARNHQIMDLYEGHFDSRIFQADKTLRVNADLKRSLSYMHKPGMARHRRVSRTAAIQTLANQKLLPAIFFIFSRSGCESALRTCLGAGLDLTTSSQKREIRKIVEERCAGIGKNDLGVLGYWTWLNALERGFSSHHAGMIPIFKETVEALFVAGYLKVVFATETLALGIIMPAKSVFLERLIKWDGISHADITPGQYTQLTGRAGRRGIDVEGHAVVLEHPQLDVNQLASLAGRRTYPLNSSFRPTYNMSVNMLDRLGIKNTRETLEMSFAQFQTDSSLVGQSRKATEISDAISGYTQASECELGDVWEFIELRESLSKLQKEASRQRRSQRNNAGRKVLREANIGDVLHIEKGRFGGHVLVLNVLGNEGMLQVLTARGRVEVLQPNVISGEVQRITYVELTKRVNPKIHKTRKNLLEQLHRAIHGQPKPNAKRKTKAEKEESSRAEKQELQAFDEKIRQLRNKLKSHSLNSCPDLEEHLLWASRTKKLGKQLQVLETQIATSTGSIAREFERVCKVLSELDYVSQNPLQSEENQQSGQELFLTPKGTLLKGLYVENDLLFAQVIFSGVIEHLKPAQLAAWVATLVFENRNELTFPMEKVEQTFGPQFQRAFNKTVLLWSKLDDLEKKHKISSVRQPELGFCLPIFKWVQGNSLQNSLQSVDMSPGDFVRWAKQVIDALGHIVATISESNLARTANEAINLIRRDVVAYESV